jgi:hypothetical protein
MPHNPVTRAGGKNNGLARSRPGSAGPSLRRRAGAAVAETIPAQNTWRRMKNSVPAMRMAAGRVITQASAMLRTVDI